jgi:Protein of unknown function (DUF1601)
MWALPWRTSQLGRAATCCGFRARLFADNLMAAPGEAEWGQLYVFCRRGEDAMAFAHSMPAQSVSNTLWAGAKVGLGFPSDVLAALLAAIAQAAGTMNAQAVANTVWALESMHAAGKLGAEVPSDARAAMLRRMHNEAYRLNSQDVANCLHGLANLGWDVPDRVRGALLQRLQQTAGSMSSQDVANSVYALGRLGWRVSVPIMASLFAAIERVWVHMIPQEVANTLYGLASMPAVVDREVHVPPRTHANLCSALMRQAPRMTEQQVANSAWALGQLRWHFDDGVEGALEAWLMEHASELTPQGVSNTLLGLAAAAAPLSAEAMAALLTAADASLLCGHGTEEPVQQFIGNTLYALAVLAHLGVTVKEGLVLRLAQAGLRYQLEVEGCFQVREDLLVERLGLQMCMHAGWGREGDSHCIVMPVQALAGPCAFHHACMHAGGRCRELLLSGWHGFSRRLQRALDCMPQGCPAPARGADQPRSSALSACCGCEAAGMPVAAY